MSGRSEACRLIVQARSPMWPASLPLQVCFPPMLFTFLLVVHAIIAALLVTVILMQKSEGGGLTTGGSPSGLMSARGAADFLTRATATLATLFILMSIALAVIASTRNTTTIDPGAIKAVAPGAQGAPRSAPGEGPLSGGTGAGPFSGAAGVAAGNEAAPAAGATGGNSSVPLAQ